MLREYLPVLLLLGFAAVNGLLMIGLGEFLSRSSPTYAKSQAYESGMSPLGDSRDRFSVKFYLVAMLFIVFDIETVFLIPWGVQYQQLSCAVELVNGVCAPGNVSFLGLGSMLVFAGVLLVGYVYVWKRGGLTWD